ncbi:hypothetical protein QR680_014309 [Steinernema hermaphroditum]|uniref:Uncharacterized protein n=1 Tax=Steinernema hermaphroditum TaxID=289476 RepID=A0AA39M409_9BILA|nr:hypothetical protein QR680_014309 [Steinernema hermaphroditum]
MRLFIVSVLLFVAVAALDRRYRKAGLELILKIDTSKCVFADLTGFLDVDIYFGHVARDDKLVYYGTTKKLKEVNEILRYGNVTERYIKASPTQMASIERRCAQNSEGYQSVYENCFKINFI